MERAFENVVYNMAAILFWPKRDSKHDYVYAYYIIVANRNATNALTNVFWIKHLKTNDQIS